MANDEALISKQDSYTIEHSKSAELCRAKQARPARHQLLEPKKHKKRRRNIALESILQILQNDERNDANCSSEQFMVLTAEDVAPAYPDCIDNRTGGTDQANAEHTENTYSCNKTDPNDKVNHWMTQMLSPIQRKTQSKCVVREAIRLDPSSMFKKKVKLDVAKPRSEGNCEALNQEKCPVNGSAAYVPSASASLCYQRYLENNKQLQIR